MEFMLAMNEYKQKSGRMFPTWSEVLEVLRGLGYEKPVLDVGGRLTPARRGLGVVRRPRPCPRPDLAPAVGAVDSRGRRLS